MSKEAIISKYNPKHKKCKQCGEILEYSKYTYCSVKCQVDAKKARDKKKKREKRKGVTKEKLDKLWSKKVRERDGECMYCRKKENLNAHHIYSRSNHSVRWDITNGISLCPKHHLFSDEFAAHKTPLEFTEFVIRLYGQEFIDDLKLKANAINDKTHEEWWDILSEEKKQQKI